MIEAARAYLALLREPPAGDRVAALAAALDRLAGAYHATPETEASDEADRPNPPTYEQLRDIAAAAFPDLGYYAVTRPEPSGTDAIMAGDAIDDLADIALELEHVVWLWENARAGDAAWHYRFGYRTHWGRHLHDLRSHLHARQFET